MVRKFVFMVIGFCAVVFTASCQGNPLFGLFKKQKAVAPEPAVEKPAPMEISGELLAEVNDWRIGLDDFNNKLTALKSLGVSPKEVDPVEFKRSLLNDMVRLVILAQEAKKRGMDKDADVKSALADYERTLLVQKLVEDLSKDIVVTDIEIENFYEQNKDIFRSPPQLKIREIAVGSEVQARDIYVRLLQGEDFAAMARESSVLPSKDKGGDLGYVVPFKNKGKFPKYWQVVEPLDTGAISAIFKDDYGKHYYIVKVEDRKESKATPLQEVKDKIREALKIEKQNKILEDLVNKAKANSRITINDDLLR